jgi:hypothetical protein
MSFDTYSALTALALDERSTMINIAMVRAPMIGTHMMRASGVARRISRNILVEQR